MYRFGFYTKRGYFISSDFFDYDTAMKFRFSGHNEFLLSSDGQLEFKFWGFAMTKKMLAEIYTNNHVGFLFYSYEWIETFRRILRLFYRHDFSWCYEYVYKRPYNG